MNTGVNERGQQHGHLRTIVLLPSPSIQADWTVNGWHLTQGGGGVAILRLHGDI